MKSLSGFLIPYKKITRVFGQVSIFGPRVFWTRVFWVDTEWLCLDPVSHSFGLYFQLQVNCMRNTYFSVQQQLLWHFSRIYYFNIVNKDVNILYYKSVWVYDSSQCGTFKIPTIKIHTPQNWQGSQILQAG